MEEHLNDGAERASEFFLNDVVADILRDTADAFSGSEILVPNTSFSFLTDKAALDGWRVPRRATMAMTEIDHLILGGGPAGATAAVTLRLEDAASSIMVLSADDRPPYYRPALSKQFLVGSWPAERVLLHPESFYREQRIELSLNVQVVSLDTAARIVTTANNERIRYGHLLIATGARPKQLAVPGTDLPGVHHLRGKTECLAVRHEITAGARRAVVLGASFLGMEIAMSLIDLGLAVTIIESRDLVLPHLESGRLSDYFRRHAQERGAALLLSDTVTAIHGSERISVVETASGLRLPCDLLMVSVGVEPATDFLKASGVALDQGLVIVDDQLRTSAAGVFAAGDVTRFFDPVFTR
ncbi:MAG TPA: NAD(P)/FAD-dependent oxidoreductase, partial [Stellaceae bacterium]|nr:NAD(P)/FAD-dependent oxidoreductase [Stellaceae bacterium]